jgi:hypothetical protein
MNNETVNNFIRELTKQLIRENDDRKYQEKRKLNIPYIIAPLVQNLNNDTYKKFIEDISNHSYFINYFSDNTGGYTNGYIDVNIYKKSEEDCNDFYCPELESYSYKIEFGKDQRDWGYCECIPEDEGYREDKDCCGYGCNWTAPTFKVEKFIYIGNNSWEGYQHDYWEFEDEFYKSDKELAEEKAKKEKEDRIEYLKSSIESMQKELFELA